MPDRITSGVLYSRIARVQSDSQAVGKPPVRDKAFDDILSEEIRKEGIKFSGHAQTRLRSRGIELTSDGISRLSEAISKAESKGAKESLILLDDLAMVVSVINRTVITAVDNSEAEDHVFTNIDSAVIMR
jgi:flagellar operon protein